MCPRTVVRTTAVARRVPSSRRSCPISADLIENLARTSRPGRRALGSHYERLARTGRRRHRALRDLHQRRSQARRHLDRASRSVEQHRVTSPIEGYVEDSAPARPGHRTTGSTASRARCSSRSAVYSCGSSSLRRSPGTAAPVPTTTDSTGSAARTPRSPKGERCSALPPYRDPQSDAIARGEVEAGSHAPRRTASRRHNSPAHGGQRVRATTSSWPRPRRPAAGPRRRSRAPPDRASSARRRRR